MSAPRLGFIGENFDLQIAQGCTFGPYQIQLLNPDGSPVNLTGAVVGGQIRKLPTDVTPIAEFEISYGVLADGFFSFGLADEITATIPAGETLDSDESIYLWALNLKDSLGRILPLFYGNAYIFRQVSHV